jgi:hypothetical protein
MAAIVAVAALVGCGGKGGSTPSEAPAGPDIETYTVTTVATSTARFTTTATTSGTAGGYVALQTTAGGVAYDIGNINTNGSYLWVVFGFVPQLLRYPVVLNDTWTYNVTSNGYHTTSTMTVTSVSATVTVPAGTFGNVVVVQETLAAPAGYYSAQVIDSRIRSWAPGVGLIKEEVAWHGGSTTTAELQHYTVSGSGTDLFPLGLGNAWTYAWTFHWI